MGQLVFIPFSSAGAAPAPSGVFDIYLSGRNGSDANDGLTPATAKATPAGVWELFPAGLSGPLVVHCGAAGVVGDDVAYDWSTIPVPAQLNASARIWIYGDGAGQAGEDGFEVITTGSCAPGTDALQVTIATPVAVNVYQHYTLEMLDGPAVGYRRTVQQNTTTSIIPVRQFDNQAGSIGSVTPVSGNAFRILRPSVIFSGIDALEGQPSFLGGFGEGDSFAPLILVNIAFAATTTSVSISGSCLYMAGVEFRGVVFPFFTTCTGSLGWWDHIDGAGPGLPRSTAIDTAKSQWFEDIGETAALARLAEWRGWSVSVPDVVSPSGAVSIANFMTFTGCFMSAVGTFNAVRTSACCMVLGGYFWGTIRTSQSYIVLSGRGSTVANACVSRYWMVLTGFVVCNVPLVHESVNGGIEVQNNCFFSLSTTSVTSTITVATDQFAMLLTGGATVFAANGTFTLSSPCTSGVLGMRAQARIVRLTTSSQTWNITNTGAGPSITLENGSIFEGQTGTLTAVGAVTLDNAVFKFSGTTSITGNLTLINDSTLICTALTVSGTSIALTATDSNVLLSGTGTFTGIGGTAVSLTNAALSTSAALNTTGGVALFYSRFLSSASVGITAAASTGLALSRQSSFTHTAGSLIVSSNNAALSLLDNSSFASVNTSVVSLTSTVGDALLGIDSDFVFMGTSVTFVGGNGFGIDTFNCDVSVRATCTFTACGIGASSSRLYFSVAAAINGVISLQQQSSLITAAAFSSTGASNITDSVCIHISATPSYNSGSTMSLVRSEIRANQGLTIQTLTAYGSRILSASSLPSGTTTFGGATVLSQSELVLGNTTVFSSTLTSTKSIVNCGLACTVTGLATLTGTLMSATGILTFTAGVSATGAEIVAGNNLVSDFVLLNASSLKTSAVVTIANSINLDASDWIAVGAMGASNITTLAGRAIDVAGGSIVNLSGVTSGTLTVAGLLADACIQVVTGSSFYFDNARILTTTSNTGLAFGSGARIYCTSASASNIVGLVNDFLDEQGGFSDALITANRCVFTGQHPAGVYDNAQPIIGSGFVQRV